MPGVFDLAFPEVFPLAFPDVTEVPKLLKAYVSSDGNRLFLRFNEAVVGSSVPELSFSGGAVTAEYIDGSGGVYVVFTLSRSIGDNETGTLTLEDDDYVSVEEGYIVQDIQDLPIEVAFGADLTVPAGGDLIFDVLSDLLVDVLSGSANGSGADIPELRPPVAVIPPKLTVDFLALETTTGYWLNDVQSYAYSWEQEPLGPTNSVAPVLTGDPEDGETLTVTPGTWTDSGDVEIEYQWYRDGVPIIGIYGSSLILGSIDVGAEITVEEIANNGRGETVYALGPVTVIA